MKSTVKEIIMNALPTDSNAAVSAGRLRQLTGLSLRRLKQIITELRYEYPICSKETDGGGYWLANEPADVYDFMGMIARRRDGYNNTLDVMAKHLERMTWQ